jgi:general secretion pathway protein H
MQPAILRSQTGNLKSAGGYTLVELLAVLAVISLLIAATPAIISAARSKAEADFAAYQLAHELRSARSSAIVNDADRVVVVDLKAKNYVVTPGGRPHPLPTTVILTFEGPQDTQIGDRAMFRFFPDGSSSGGRIRIASGAKLHVVVDHGLTGRISIDE